MVPGAARVVADEARAVSRQGGAANSLDQAWWRVATPGDNSGQQQQRGHGYVAGCMLL
jgi:hypothetical protein